MLLTGTYLINIIHNIMHMEAYDNPETYAMRRSGIYI